MSRVASISTLMRVRRVWDRLAVYLPLLLMGVMAMGTYWLVRSTPVMSEAEIDAPLRHEPDYVMRDFSVKVFADDGTLKSEITGSEGRHFPDTDTLEIDQPRIRMLSVNGRLTMAVAKRGLINSDASEVQLFDKAVVTREGMTSKQGEVVPRIELQSDFLHVVSNTEEVRSHLPVVMIRGSGNRFSADGMTYDNLGRALQLTGRVRGTLLPRQEKK
jgi:lipopolysaccharide export system protein LptC|nr:LPS export ABC transporter periplasmic protein LptC [uncultured Limnohabitans sp.]